MLRLLSTKAELEKALEVTVPYLPQSGPVHYALRFQSEGKFSDVQYENLAFPWPNISHICIICHNPRNPLPQVFIHIPEDYSTTFFEQLTTQYFNHPPGILLSVASQTVAQNVAKVATKTKITRICVCDRYTVPEEERKKLIQETIEAPQGYIWDTLNNDDIPVLTKTWPYSAEDEHKAMKQKINNLPTVALREEKTKELASFEMVSYEGLKNHLFTMDKHRRKGLATLIEKRLAQKLIEQDIVPCKMVDIDKEGSVKFTKASSLWKEIKGHQGHWMYFEPKN